MSLRKTLFITFSVFVVGIVMVLGILSSPQLQAACLSSTVTAGTSARASQYNNLRQDFYTGKFFDSACAGSNYLQVLHNGTDGVIQTNTGKVRISPPTGSQIDLEVNGTDVLTVAGSAVTSVQPLTASSTLGVSGNTTLAGTLYLASTALLAGLTTHQAGIAVTGGNLKATNSAGFSGSVEIDGYTQIDGAAAFTSTTAHTGVATFTGAITASSTTATALNYGVQLSSSANRNTPLKGYFESSYTPTYQGSSSAGAGTYSVQVGAYTQIGNVVTFHYYITTSAHTGTGNFDLVLPVRAANTTNFFQACPAPDFQNLTIPAASVLGSGIINPGAPTVMTLRSCPNASGGTCASLAIDVAMTVFGSCTYRTDTL